MDFQTHIFFKQLAFQTQGSHGCLGVQGDPQNSILRVLGATLRFWGSQNPKTSKLGQIRAKKPIFEEFLDPSTPKTPGSHLKAAKLSSVDPPCSLRTIEHSGCGMLVKILMNQLFFSANIGTRWLLVTLFYYIELKLLVHYVIQSTKLGEFLSCSIQNIKNCKVLQPKYERS